jgi:hypothetical protein
MTITSENDNDVIVYALEKVISYARRTEQIFVAQVVWWLASIIGLEQGLINHIDNLQSQSDIADRKELRQVPVQSERIISPTSRDIQEESHCSSPGIFVHPDRKNQLNNLNPDISDPDLSASRPRTPSGVIDSSNQFLAKSRKERTAFFKQKRIDQLSCTRSGKVLKQPLSKGQRKYLQCIPKDTIAEYLADRKYDLRPYAQYIIQETCIVI